jgi:hypothetical protein
MPLTDLKTVVREDLWVRVPRPPLRGISRDGAGRLLVPVAQVSVHERAFAILAIPRRDSRVGLGTFGASGYASHLAMSSWRKRRDEVARSQALGAFRRFVCTAFLSMSFARPSRRVTFRAANMFSASPPPGRRACGQPRAGTRSGTRPVRPPPRGSSASRTPVNRCRAPRADRADR